MHPIENYRLIHKDDSDAQLLVLKQATMPDSPEYLAVVSLLEERAVEREKSLLEKSGDNGSGDSAHKKIVIGVIITVLGGLLLILIRRRLGW